MSQLTVTLAFPGIATTPAGVAGGGRAADSTMVILVVGKPLELAERVMEPGMFVDCTMTSARPLKRGICVPLSASWELGFPLPTPEIVPPLTVKVTMLLAVGTIFPC